MIESGTVDALAASVSPITRVPAGYASGQSAGSECAVKLKPKPKAKACSFPKATAVVPRACQQCCMPTPPHLLTRFPREDRDGSRPRHSHFVCDGCKEQVFASLYQSFMPVRIRWRSDQAVGGRCA